MIAISTGCVLDQFTMFVIRLPADTVDFNIFCCIDFFFLFSKSINSWKSCFCSNALLRFCLMSFWQKFAMLGSILLWEQCI